jgi:hypothetical protein
MTTTLKSVRLTRLPSLLCLHLQRRVYGPYGVTKDTRRVTYVGIVWSYRPLLFVMNGVTLQIRTALRPV